MREKIRAMKQHITENKNVYIVGGVLFVSGLAVGYVSATGRGQSIKTLVFGNWRSNVTVNNIVEQTLVRRGHPGFRILCRETGEQFASIRRAAACLNISRNDIQEHLKGFKDSVEGLTFTNLGEMQ